MAKPVARPFFMAVRDFASGKDTPAAFLDRCVASIEEFEPAVGAFVHLDIEAARAAAERSSERWRTGKALSPIDGMPVGIKDIIETVDMPTQCGSPVFEGWWSGRDAASAIALRQAGAIIVGKTVTTEFAAVVPGKTRNPWDLARTPGGSSSGSAAAVATGMVSAALGTQVLCSILKPASFCGIIGFKPSLGAINRGGSHDGLSQSVHGPLAASLEDAWNVTWQIANRVGGDPGYPGLYGPAEPPMPLAPKRLALLETKAWTIAEPAAKTAFEASLARIRNTGIEVIDRRNHPLVAMLETALEKAAEISRQIYAWESIWPFNGYRAKNASKLSGFMLERLAAAETSTLDEYRSFLAQREHIRTLHAKLASDCSAIVTLSTPGPAPLGLSTTGNPDFNAPASLLGVPAITLPVLSVGDLPLGVQAMGFLNEDAALFSTAAWLRDLLSSKCGDAMHHPN